MERSGPTFVPEWLKNAGTSTTGSCVSYSDDQLASGVARSKSFANSIGHDFGRSSSSERITSSYSHRSSSGNSSGSYKHYSSFGCRNQRDRDWGKDASHDQDNSILGDRRHRNFSDPLGDTSLSKFERGGLRNSQSMISGKRGDSWPKKVTTDSCSASGENIEGLVAKGSPVAGVSKATYGRNFPSLGDEERVVISEVGRVPSPGLTTAIQSLPIGTSAFIAGEKWTSTLAEVPVLIGSNGTSSTSMLQVAPSSSTSVSLGSTTSLNMAEAVVQGPIHAQTTPRRLEELAIKQSRQLIPVTPSNPKTLVLNSSDKQKSKVGQHKHTSLPLNHSPRGGPMKGDAPKVSSVGKLLVLKPVREKNGVDPVVKDILGPPSGSSHAAAPSVTGPAPAAMKPIANCTGLDRKTVLSAPEKRSTSQAQSRNDFFNLVREKSMATPVSSDSTRENSQSARDTGTAVSPSFSDKGTEMELIPATIHPLEAPLSVENLSEEKANRTCYGDGCDAPRYDIGNGEKHPGSDPIISEEEEAAFLRSLGWEENDDEGGLTEEEISAFYMDLTKYINSKPSLRILHRVQLKFLVPLYSELGGGIGGISSGLSSADAKLES